MFSYNLALVITSSFIVIRNKKGNTGEYQTHNRYNNNIINQHFLARCVQLTLNYLHHEYRNTYNHVEDAVGLGFAFEFRAQN